jgi:hypothetical protein
MNYIKPEDIKEYVSQHPEGIAGMSEELTAMVNHFAELIVKECVDIADETALGETTYGWMVANRIKEHFGVEE